MKALRQEGEAIVSTVYGAYYNLLPGPNLTPVLRARLRGRLRLNRGEVHKPALRHPVMIGDRVRFRLSEKGEGNEAVITEVLPRENALHRASSRELQALGANLDRALLVTALANPKPNFRLVDRFLVSCFAGEVEPLLLFSKTDLLGDDAESGQCREMVSLYRDLGYQVFTANLTALRENRDFRILKENLLAGVTLLTGESGTGKSTMLNRVFGRPIQKTAAVSSSTRKGRHTTTNSVLVPLEEGRAMIIDSPGIREWGIMHLDRRSLAAAFPEFRSTIEECPFANCRHQEEDSRCALQQLLGATAAEKKSLIHPERLESFRAMLDSLKYPEKIRTGDYIKPTGRFRS